MHVESVLLFSSRVVGFSGSGPPTLILYLAPPIRGGQSPVQINCFCRLCTCSAAAAGAPSIGCLPPCPWEVEYIRPACPGGSQDGWFNPGPSSELVEQIKSTRLCSFPASDHQQSFDTRGTWGCAVGFQPKITQVAKWAKLQILMHFSKNIHVAIASFTCCP